MNVGGRDVQHAADRLAHREGAFGRASGAQYLRVRHGACARRRRGAGGRWWLRGRRACGRGGGGVGRSRRGARSRRAVLGAQTLEERDHHSIVRGPHLRFARDRLLLLARLSPDKVDKTH